MYLRVGEVQGQQPGDSFLGEALPQGPERLANCRDYEKGEVQKSRTAQGHLPSDVIVHPRGLLLADFVVNWRAPRESLKREKALQDWLATTVKVIAANPTTAIRILGFSDCLGNERNNQLLRRGRAIQARALLHRMLGNGAAWNSLKSKIVFTDGAPTGDYAASNATAEGRAQNRSVLLESHRSVGMDPIVVSGCVVRPSQVQTYPLMGLIPNVPFDRAMLPLVYRLDAKKIVRKTAQDISQKGSKAKFVIELVDMGITAAEIFGEAGILGVLSRFLSAAAGFLALGEGCAEAAEEVAKKWSARGYSRGVVVGADGRKAVDLKARFGNDIFPSGICETAKVAKANYLAGLYFGFQHGRTLCPNQREWFWRDLGQRMGDQSSLGPSSRWSDHERTLWYASAAGTFRNAHLD